MTRKINILSPDLANKIAAGEVVQRPASVVKELVENSIDAGATKISVIVKDAGKALIQVIDNGEGMSEEDAAMAFRRHATSKIHSVADLEQICSLGFRGEALASIAAVSQVEMKTRQASDDVGTLLRIEGDEIKERSKTACEQGTSIVVKNIFFNTPARRNFLKTRQTELKNITDVVVRYAIAYPAIEWKYVSDDEVLLDLKKKQLEDRILDLFGKKQFESLIELKEELELLSISGFLGKPDFARKGRAEQYVFLNGRFIFSKLVNHAAFQAYEHLLQTGSYPFFILFLTIDPKKIDVNVHPSKQEVKFENESNVYQVVLSAVRRALATHDIIPSVTLQEGTATQSFDDTLRLSPQAWNANQFQSATAPIFTIPKEDRNSVQRGAGGTIIGIEEDQSQNTLFPRKHGEYSAQSLTASINQRLLAHTETEEQEGRAIWQIHNKYIISQIKSGIMIVDQHVAHERILYERVLNNFQNSLPATQQLLFPETIELHPSDYSLVKELQQYLEQVGFALKLFGKNTVVLEGIPADVRIGNERKILQDVLDEYKVNEHGGLLDIRDNLAKSFACKAAIKAGDKLTTSEMIILIDQLFATKMPFVCPHGRPIIIKIPLEELDKRFGRT